MLQSVYRMLESKLFRKHNVSATSWVFQQVQFFDDVEPLPSIVPKIIHELVQKYVIHSLFIFSAVAHPNFAFQMELLTMEQIQSVIEQTKQPNSAFTPRAIILYYVLIVNGNQALESMLFVDSLPKKIRLST